MKNEHSGQISWRSVISHGRFNIFVFDTLPSTNTFLKTHHAGFEDYSVIRAVSQTGGRGRFQRMWRAQAGRDLCVSVKLPLGAVPSRNRPNLAQLAALAVVRTLSSYGLSALIKWPNDVLVAGAKICGILCETAGNDAAMVVGIGVNINSSQVELADVGQPATSVLAQTGREICPEGFLKKILDELAALFDQFERLGLAAIIDPLRHYLAYKGERISLAVSDRIHDGRIVGLNEEGALLFECERDGLLTVFSGEMSVRRSD